MKILVFGIDGLGVQSIKALGLTRLNHRMQNSSSSNPAIDNVISRGWPEIYSGLDAYETGSFYQYPQLKNGRIVPSQKTGLDCVKEHIPNERILWNALNLHGLKCGVFSVPTTSKPEHINGFFVAATGAGKIRNDISYEDIFPSNLFDGLNIEDIDLGLRMGYGAFIPKNLNQLEQRGKKHLGDFFCLLEKSLERNNVDVCFAVSRFINELSYKFVKLCLSEPSRSYEKELKRIVVSLGDEFDSMLDNFITSINPDHLFVVSDHGIGPLNYHVNLNEILTRTGYIVPSNITIKEFMRPIVNPIRGKMTNIIYAPTFPRYNLMSSKLFSIGFTDAIYLNDERFAGPATKEEGAHEQSKLAAEKLNQYAINNNLSEIMNFVALNVPKYAGKDTCKIPLPNIRCYLRDGYTNTERTNRKVVEPNHCDFSSSLFKKGFFGEYSGCKTNDTVAFYQGSSQELIKMADLKQIYHSIINVAIK